MINKRVYWVIIICVFCAFLIIIFAKRIGTFEKLVLHRYQNQNELDVFTEIEIHKFNDTKRSIRYDDDVIKIRQILNEFKKLTVFKYQGILWTKGDLKYLIFLDNHITKKHAIVAIYENKIITSNGDYKILNTNSTYKTLLKTIDDIYDSLSNEVNLQKLME